MLTAESRQRDFPTLDGIAYLNTAAESIPPLCVFDAVSDYCNDKAMGMRGRDPHFARVEQCREVAARMIGLQPKEVSFCSCSSEAYNLLASALNLKADDEVVLTDIDFPAGATPWLTATEKPRVSLWKIRDGVLEILDLLPLLTSRTRLVQFSLISFYNGYRIPWHHVVDKIRRMAPQAIIAVDVTQALGRVVLDCNDADVIISSTHKWTLGLHGGCIVGIPERNAQRLTTHAGGWFHLENAFGDDRFDRVVKKTGAASFSVGMPSFAPIYALNAALRYLEQIGVEAISQHADPLVAKADAGLRALGLTPMVKIDQVKNPTGIIAFKHPEVARFHAALEAAEVHVMHHAGRLRVAIHGYNTEEDVDRLLAVLRECVESLK
ncbi:MAG: csd 1 [Verrucomicrobiaceae bacterium]|nr:csd 1 [Verrucomicrobiaceae bacterium]